MTFEWEDINDELLEKVVCFSFCRSSGMGDAGYLSAVTESGQEYFIGLDKCTWKKEIELFYRFLGERPSADELEGNHEIGKWRLVEFCYIKHFVRKDYADKIFSEWQKARVEDKRYDEIYAVRKLLDPQNKLPQMVLAETQAIWNEEERWRKEQEEWRAKNRLVEGEDYEWKEFGNGFDCGYYLLLFKENDDGTISGSKWTIVCQREQFEEGGFKSDAPVEAYNLYYKRYDNMGGILNYFVKGSTDDAEIYRYTTLTDYDYGRFHRTYFTLEEAKSAAMTRNECIGWGEYYKTNLLKRNWSDMTLEEAKKDYFRAVKRKSELQLLFPQICGEVFRILSKYDTPGNAISEIAKTIKLSENDVRIIWSFFSDCSMFTERGLKQAEKLLTEAKEFYDV